MLFNSHEFIFLFLPAALVGYFVLSRRVGTQAGLGWLLFMSLVFYGYWDVRYVPGLLLSIGANFWLGRRLQQSRSVWLLHAAVWLNLAVLAYFKYTGFIYDTISDWMVLPQPDWVHPTLPLGISFFTFTQIAWLVDSRRGDTAPASLLTYAVFVTFSPHLIAGPILHHRDVLPQFSRLRTFIFSHRNTALGLFWFSLGLFKKVVVADQLAAWVQPVFAEPHSATFLDAWVGALGYTLQLYCDFSGYSDMAIGLGLLVNVRLPLNFFSPYQADSVIEFWRRWHMTLGWFLRSYLYIPLGGNRCGRARHIVNVLITMVLCGLWHGAGWTFLLWGLLHGLYLSLNHLWRQYGPPLPATIRWLLTFMAVLWGWVLFRAESVADALALYGTMLGAKGVMLPLKYEHTWNWLANWGVQFTDTVLMRSGLDHLMGLLALTVAAVFLPNSAQLAARFTPTRLWWCLAVGAAALSLLFLRRASEFLYFQF